MKKILLTALSILLIGLCTNCFSDVRFIDNSDGTVRDCLTDLIWLKNANCFGKQNHGMARILSEELNSGECGLTDGSVEGDWSYPSKEQLQGIGTDPPTTWYEFMPPVSWSMPPLPFIDVRFNSYWSSDMSATNSHKAWMVAASNGNTVTQFRVEKYYIWPVRGNGGTGCDSSIDTDSDGIPDSSDNCPVNCNTQQLDADVDGIGDVCDKPDDGCDGCGNGTICEEEC